MSNMTVYQPAAGALIPFDEIQKMAKAVAASGLFGLKNEAQAVALMLFAQSENLHPMTAVRDYHIMGGKPSMKADTMLARFQSAGGEVEWERYDDEAVIGIFSNGKRKPVRVEWTMARAKTIMQEVWEDGPRGRQKTSKPITDKEVWKYYPRNMLRARCTSEGIRAVMPGVLCGLYTPEEIQDISHIAIAETSGPDLPTSIPVPDPEPLFVPPGILAELAACTDYASCKVWLAQSRQKIGITDPNDTRYAELQRQAAARVKQLQETITPAPPQPEPDPSEPELEPDYHQLEAEAQS